jgi:hypothetical protein
MSSTQFTTIRIADILDSLVDALDTARITAAADSRWMTALDVAADWLVQQEEIEYDFARHALSVQSASNPNLFYVANGDCQCAAFVKHTACWHRAAARLVRRALELDRAKAALKPARTLEEKRATMVAAFATLTPTAPRFAPTGKTAEEELLECFA